MSVPSLARMKSSAAALKAYLLTLPWGVDRPQNVRSGVYPAYSYMLHNPDVSHAYSVGSLGMGPAEFARAHYDNHGAAEGRTWPRGYGASS